MNDIHKKFPPERKDEFLNWLMLTQEKRDWCPFVLKYMGNHQLKNWYEGAEFAVKWSDDPSWYAYYMVANEYAEPEWAMKVIENDKTGNPSYAAYLMVEDGYAKEEWAMKVIENDTIGNPSWAAYRVVKKGFAEPEWAMKIIENDKIGSPSWCARWMVENGYAPQEWAERIKKQ